MRSWRTSCLSDRCTECPYVVWSCPKGSLWRRRLGSHPLGRDGEVTTSPLSLHRALRGHGPPPGLCAASLQLCPGSPRQPGRVPWGQQSPSQPPGAGVLRHLTALGFWIWRRTWFVGALGNLWSGSQSSRTRAAWVRQARPPEDPGSAQAGVRAPGPGPGGLRAGCVSHPGGHRGGISSCQRAVSLLQSRPVCGRPPVGCGRWFQMPECAAAIPCRRCKTGTDHVRVSWQSDRIGIQNQVSGPCPLPGNVDVHL